SVFAVAVVIAGAGPASAQDQSVRQDIDQLRRELDALKQEYGQRLAALEAKISAAEGAAGATPATPPAGQPGAGPGPPAPGPAPRALVAPKARCRSTARAGPPASPARRSSIPTWR